jgi:hypothetical protein
MSINISNVSTVRKVQKTQGICSNAHALCLYAKHVSAMHACGVGLYAGHSLEVYLSSCTAWQEAMFIVVSTPFWFPLKACNVWHHNYHAYIWGTRSTCRTADCCQQHERHPAVAQLRSPVLLLLAHCRGLAPCEVPSPKAVVNRISE